KWWVPGLGIGFGESFTHQVADFLEGLKKKKPAAPTFRDALETNRVCDAIIASGKSGKWVKL
ncbi:MAG TPA: Gfo/Idh/MocA family oxidoreductase, partial [Devosia sp.]|nr:Gfo/Idh/MocA family oxidoreductase [Devosia sp.]